MVNPPAQAPARHAASLPAQIAAAGRQRSSVPQRAEWGSSRFAAAPRRRPRRQLPPVTVTASAWSQSHAASVDSAVLQAADGAQQPVIKDFCVAIYGGCCAPPQACAWLAAVASTVHGTRLPRAPAPACRCCCAGAQPYVLDFLQKPMQRAFDPSCTKVEGRALCLLACAKPLSTCLACLRHACLVNASCLPGCPHASSPPPPLHLPRRRSSLKPSWTSRLRSWRAAARRCASL